MTFEEAFNSGCRFKLPPEANGEKSWPEGFYWVKCDYDSIKWGSDDEIYHGPERFDAVFHDDQALKNRTDWYLHPEDEHRMKFGQKLEDIIRET